MPDVRTHDNKGEFEICLDSSTPTSSSTWYPYSAKNISITWESLASSDSGRSDDGTMHISWVRSNIRKFTITMPPLNYLEVYRKATNPLKLVQGTTYWLKIWDIEADTEAASAPADNMYQLVHVYTSNTQAECYNGILYDGLWQGIQFSAIEV